MALLKQSTACTRMFYLGGTGLGPSCAVSKNGGGFASSVNSPAEVASGWYSLLVDASETDTPGALCYHFSAGAFADFQDQVAPEVQADVALWRGQQPDALVSNLVPAKVMDMAAGVLTASAIASAALTSAKFASGAIDSSALAASAANEIADAILDRTDGIETNYPLRQALRLILSAVAAKLSGADTSTVTIRDIGDTKDRISATVDDSGNRTAVTLDAA